MAKIPPQQLGPLAWAVLWRMVLLATPASAVAAGLTGLLLGIFTGLTKIGAGPASGSADVLAMVVGALVGLWASYLVLRLILRSLVEKKIGGFIILPLSRIVSEEPLTKSQNSQNNAVSEA